MEIIKVCLGSKLCFVGRAVRIGFLVVWGKVGGVSFLGMWCSGCRVEGSELVDCIYFKVILFRVFFCLS